jgi:hypothetical protein
MFPDVSESLTPTLTLSVEEVLNRSDFQLSPTSTTPSSHAFRNASMEHYFLMQCIALSARCATTTTTLYSTECACGGSEELG